MNTAALAATSADTSKAWCACGRVDVHSHFLPEPYRRASSDAGLARVDGGMPVPQWSAAAHLSAMDALGVSMSMLSSSSPGLHFLEGAKARRLAGEVNEIGAGLSRDPAIARRARRPGRIGLPIRASWRRLGLP